MNWLSYFVNMETLTYTELLTGGRWLHYMNDSN